MRQPNNGVGNATFPAPGSNNETTRTNTELHPAPQQKSLVRKLTEVMAAVGYVPKNGKNTFHGYNYATEADLVDAVRGELAKRKVFVFSNLISHERKEHTNQKGNKTFLTDVVIEWTFEDAESGETRSSVFPGCGEDAGDKGGYKAITGSEKYFLMKSFLIPTGDDPEQDDNGNGAPQVQAPRQTLPRPAQRQPLPQRPMATTEQGKEWEGNLTINNLEKGYYLAVVGARRVWVNESSPLAAGLAALSGRRVRVRGRETERQNNFELLAIEEVA